MDKEALRSSLRQRRREFVESLSSESQLQLQKSIWEQLQPYLKDISSVGTYLPIGSEFDVSWINQQLHALPLTLCLPVVKGGHLSFHPWEQGAPLKKNGYGFRTLENPEREITPDFFLVPLLGFDEENYRLGYGKGHYDKYFATHSDCIKIGMAYQVQKVKKLPHDAHDIPMDTVLGSMLKYSSYTF